MPIALSLNVADVTRIANEAARQHQGLDVLGVTVTGGSDYAELFVRLQGCRTEPCVTTVGIFRDLSESELLVEVSRRLREHVETHRTEPGT